MLRLIGAVLVAGGGALAGLLAAGRLGERVRVLSSLLGALELMESEIQYKLTPVPALMQLLSERANAPAREFFIACREQLKDRGERSFSELWADSMTVIFLQMQERETLNELGGVLGQYEVEGQKRAIAYARRRLEAFLQAAEEERRQKGKVYGALGVALGLCVAIILI